MNINKAFREGMLNKWLYDAINRRIISSGKIWTLSTLLFILVTLILLLLGILNSENVFTEDFKSFAKVSIPILMFITLIIICLRIGYCVDFAREYRKFYEITSHGLDKMEDFYYFLDQAQYDSEMTKKGLALDVLTWYFSHMLQLENRLGGKYQEYPEWAAARQNFSEVYDFYKNYGLTLNGGWAPYK